MSSAVSFFVQNFLATSHATGRDRLNKYSALISNVDCCEFFLCKISSVRSRMDVS